MQKFLSLIGPAPDATRRAILSVNEKTAHYGLTLTETEALELANIFQTCLVENRIIEVGYGGVTKIAAAFAASAFAYPENYASIVNDMTEAFYYIKREVSPEVNDDAVIAAMVDYFDHVSYGSIELFLGRDMDKLIVRIESSTHWAEDPDYKIREEDRYDDKPQFTSAHSKDF